MNKKWKILLICLIILPCVVFFGGCSCNSSEETGETIYDNISYSVSFYTGSGSTFNMSTQTVKHGKYVTRPINPTREGYTFAGWYIDKDCTTVWKFESDPVLNNMTLYAKWNALSGDKNTYIVQFVTNSTDTYAITSQQINAGGLVVKPVDPIRTGYTFVAWYKNVELTKKWNFETDTVTSNLTLYAKWQKQTPA